MVRTVKGRSRTTAGINARLKSKQTIDTASDYISPGRRRQLGGIWAKGSDTWPARRIISERGTAGGIEYLLEWVEHPDTGVVYSPTWEPAANATDPDLRSEWEATRRSAVQNSSSDTVPEKKFQRQLWDRVIHSSDDSSQVSATKPHHHTETQHSIPETQQSNSQENPFAIVVPELDLDHADYDSVANTQTTLQRTPISKPAYLSQDSPLASQADTIDLSLRRYSPRQVWTPQSTSSDTTTNPVRSSRRLRYSRKDQTVLTAQAESSSSSASASPVVESSHSTVRWSSQSPMAIPRERTTPRLRSATPATNSRSSRFAGDTNHSISARGVQPDAGSVGSIGITGSTSSSAPNAGSDTKSTSETEADTMAKDKFSLGIGRDSNLMTASTNYPSHQPDAAPGSSSSLSQFETAYPMADHDQSMDGVRSTLNQSSNTTSDSERLHIRQSVEHEHLVPKSGGVVMPKRPIFEDEEYAVALPAEGKVQALYHDQIKEKRRTLLKFIRRRDSNGVKLPGPDKTKERLEILDLIDRLHGTVTHLDLAIEGWATQQELSASQIAQYATLASSKFAFLDHLLNALHQKQCCIAIFAKPGRIMELVQTFLSARDISFSFEGENSSSQGGKQEQNITGRPYFVLSSIGSSSVTELPEQTDLIMAFDASFDIQDPCVQAIRAKGPSSRPVPILRLLVKNSSEHCDVCIPTSLPSPQRLRLLARTIYQARRNIGGSPIMVIEDDIPETGLDLAALNQMMKKSPDRRLRLLANQVADAVTHPDNRPTWTFEDMPDLELDDIIETPENIDRVRTATPASRAGTPAGRKRLLELDSSNSLLAKRQRLTPLHDVTHISDSVRDSASQTAALQAELQNARKELEAQTSARIEAETAREALQQQFNDTEIELRKLNGRHEKLKRTSYDQKAMIKSLEPQLEARNTRHERIAAENVTLKDQLIQAKVELKAAREEIAGGANPPLAVLEAAREAIRLATARAERAEKSLESKNKDFDFVGEQYQLASGSAAELSAQVTVLEDQNALLQSKASDEKIRLVQYNENSALKLQASKIDELQSEKRGMELLIRRLDEENSNLKKAANTTTRAGVQTRGSSVQPPGSPGLHGSFASTGMARERSRQGSPAPGATGAGGGVHGHALSGPRASALRNER